MYTSTITIHDYIREENGKSYTWSWEEEMLIPKIIGRIKRGFISSFLTRKMLPLGHRYRGDVCTL